MDVNVFRCEEEVHCLATTLPAGIACRVSSSVKGKARMAALLTHVLENHMQIIERRLNKRPWATASLQSLLVHNATNSSCAGQHNHITVEDLQL